MKERELWLAKDATGEPRVDMDKIRTRFREGGLLDRHRERRESEEETEGS